MEKIQDDEFELIRTYIKDVAGISLGNEKKVLVFGRLKTLVMSKGFDNFKDYYDYLIKSKDNTELIDFIDKLTTNHTYFMRETAHFDYFKDIVLPEMKAKHRADKDLRVWCAACSSGEEAYTLAYLIDEVFFGESGWNTEMLATDISTKVLATAMAGIYSNESVSKLDHEIVRKYMKKYDDKHYIFIERLRKNITFRRFNLIEDNYKFRKKLQVIFCRNVMIYFDNPTKIKIIKNFFDILEPGGYLFISQSETLTNLSSDFEYIAPAVYRKPLK